MVSFMREEREQAKAERAEMEAKLEEQKGQMNSMLAEQKAQMDAKLDEQKAQIQQQQAEALKARELASAMSAVSEGQLELLQTRLDALHQAKLLTDDEIGALEDCVADYIDCCSSLNPAAAEIGAAAEKVKKMVGLSEAVGKDGMLARQLRRKFVS
jgi:chromosome segregation ATPase